MTSPDYRPLHVVFSGGVTGGHLFPGLAVAEQLAAMSPRARITFAGPGGEFDCAQVAAAGYDYVTLSCPRAPRGIADAARFGYRMLRGYRRAAMFLRRVRVSAVVGLGGFASVPASLAAARQNLPLLLLEQNAIVGRANRRLAGWADALCLSFEASRGAVANAAVLARARTIVTGTPVRKGFSQFGDYLGGTDDSFVRAAKQPDEAPSAPRQQVVGATNPRQFAGAGPILLVLGGSGGASLLNQSMPRALAELRAALDGWSVVHQAGQADVAATADAYAKSGISATVVPFLQNLPSLMAQTHLAVCRSGGSTLAELAVMRVPAVLVPWASSTDDHQRQNARAFAAVGAAMMIDACADEPASLAGHLSSALGGLMANLARRAAMSAAMHCLAKPHAACNVAEMALNLAEKGRSRHRQQWPACLVPLPCIDARAA